MSRSQIFNKLRFLYWLLLNRLSESTPRLATRLNFPERAHHGWMIQHQLGRRRPAVESVIVPDKRPTEEDVAIAARLLAAYRATDEDLSAAPAAQRPDQWTLVRERQGQFDRLMARGDSTELAAYLCNVSRHEAANGIAQGDLEHRRVLRDSQYRARCTLVMKDHLVSFAEAVGALEVENPEEPALRAHLRRDPTLLVERIGDRLGLDIAPPDTDGGMLKLKTRRGLFCERDLWAIFTAQLLRTVVSAQPRARICEIGGGSGRVAYWSHRMGLTSYTIVDLPYPAIVQGYYLLKNLPSDRVILYGEPDAGNPGYVRLVPSNTLSALAGERYDLMLNQDSFPEMHPTTVADYLTWTRAMCPEGLLMSINHECKSAYGRRGDGLAHVSVPESVERLGGFRRQHRFPFWVRKGYVVELYRVMPEERRDWESAGVWRHAAAAAG